MGATKNKVVFLTFQCFVVAPGVWDNERQPPPPGCDGFGPRPPPPVYLNVIVMLVFTMNHYLIFKKVS